jgi:hypothetical protein
MEKKEGKETRAGSLLFLGHGSGKLSIEIKEDTFEVGFVEDLFVFSCAEEESGAANIVDETGNALGVVVKESDKGVGEKLVVAEGGEL